jgi:formate dehydrogenase maturation protein FdhE
MCRGPADRTSCPCCGGVADFAYVGRGRRALVCARCDTHWETSVHGCLGCGATVLPAFARIASPGMGCTILVCSSCGRYLKEREGVAPADVDLLLDRALAEPLDLAAEQRGLRL